MLKIYGIKKCDTMKKTFDWLNKNRIKYEFHNYKETGIDKKTIENWLKYLPLDKVLNSKGTTFKALTEEEKSTINNKTKAIALMIK